MRLLFAMFAGLALATTSSQAIAQGNTHNWSGFYIGGFATEGSADTRHCDNGICAATWPRFDAGGHAFGVALGYNYQVSSWVAGLELDWSRGNLDGAAPSGGGFGCITTCFTNIYAIGTVRARAGYAFGSLLAYGTIGVAVAEYESRIGPSSGDTTRETGLTYGGGLEYALNKNLSAKVEYLYIDKLGDFNYDRLNACGGPPNCFSRMGGIDTIRFGLNFKFD
jgi:outer membrane immunogenic protein